MLLEEEDGVGVLNFLILSFASTLSGSNGTRPAAPKPLNILAFEKAQWWILTIVIFEWFKTAYIQWLKQMR